ncbi:MAG TPA: NAD(+) diphosphatase [Rhodanobacteraceae bacterium]|nr:NAD(+) diphosphatase [Rhodanobacteraceae bacterium]
MSSAGRTRHNLFADTPLDRCGEYRADPAWLAARRADAAARWLVFDAEGRAPVRDGRLCWLDTAQLADDAPANFLGQLAGAPIFALRLPATQDAFADASWLDLRTAAAAIERAEAGLFAYARSLANWQDATRHCGYCGAPVTLVDGGHRAVCSGCGRLHFPRTDAAIIVIVEHGDACLLGHQSAWRPRQYSTLAGFVEPGESLADAVRREVREETGVEVLDCDFHSSQPWPFPASLMLGFTATAAGRTIRLADGELQDARWFTARDIADGLRDGSLCVSTPLSISYRLIEHWLRTRAGIELDALPRAR